MYTCGYTCKYICARILCVSTIYIYKYNTAYIMYITREKHLCLYNDLIYKCTIFTLIHKVLFGSIFGNLRGSAAAIG